MTNWHTGRLLGFDLETTGVDTDTALPVSVALVYNEGPTMVGSIAQLIDPGIDIPAESIAIHGITTDMVIDEGAPLDMSIASILHEFAHAYHAAVPLVGMNLSFDLSIINACSDGILERVQLPPIVDLYVIDKHVDKYRKGSRKLTALCEHYGIEHGGAHNALHDVQASISCMLALVERYPYIGAMSLGALHDAQAQWYIEQVTSLSAYFVKQGKAAIPESRMQWPLYKRAEVTSED